MNEFTKPESSAAAGVFGFRLPHCITRPRNLI
jgi:hypothetical protein